MADRVGQQIDAYHLIRLLGAGGFGEVYLAEHIYRRTQVAIKVLPKLTSDDLQGFLTEARTFRLRHPHIVQVLDFGVEERTPFIVMEYAPNGTLRERHPRGTQVPLPTIVSYVQQVASALQYAHEERLIHRDVKPENMLVNSSNEVLLSDFGIATIAHGTTSQSVDTMIGTIPYMAPEQINAHPRPASDQYSLGIVVYEWLSGERPFQGSVIEIITKHLAIPPAPLREKIPALSPDVEQVVLTALAKDPKQRFGSVQAFATALEQTNRSTQPQPELVLPAQVKAEPSRQQQTRTDIPLKPLHQQVAVDSASLDMPVKPNEAVSRSLEVVSPPLSPATRTVTEPHPSKQQGRIVKANSKPEPISQKISRRRLILSLGLTGLVVASTGIVWQVFSHEQHLSAGPGLTSAANMDGPIDMQTLITNAKKEGNLQAIGIPPEWADYKDILAGYASKYVNADYKVEAEFSSTQELEVFKNSVQHAHGDIGDISFAFGPKVIQQGLVAPYKHSHWNDIPDNLKDPNGNWCTEYWGTQAFVINTDIVKNPPTSFKDLLNNDYKNMVGIDGDPRQANDAFIAVYSAALAQSGSMDDIQSGIDFFVQLKKKGNFTLARSSITNIAKGEVAIGIMWDYLGLGFRDQLAGKPNLSIVIPTDGSIAGPYVSIVNKTAPHPYAARLWIEYIFSDEGQLFYLTGYAHPARYQKLVSTGKIPSALAAKLPPADQYTNVKFVTDLNKLDTASSVLTQNWQTQVLGQ